MHTLWKSLNSIKFLSPAAGASLKQGFISLRRSPCLGGLVATACGFMLLYALWSSHSALSTGNMLFVGAVGLFGLYIGFSTVRDLKTKEKSVEGWAFYALLTVAVAAAFLGILLRNVSYTVS